MAFFSKIFGDTNTRLLKKLTPLVSEISAKENELEKTSDEELKSKTNGFKERLERDDSLDDVLPEAFAAVREAAKRTLGQRHFDVQMLGGIILHQGKVAEMKTGEGKTLAATLPAYLNALAAKGVHIITVNDYLARRDTVWMGQIYHALGLSVGCINHEASFLYDPTHTQDKLDEIRDTEGSFKVVHEYLRPCSRRDAYAADITYGTNNEFGFDYLRDNLIQNSAGLSQREHYFAIVDEVDSIFIDEARTPLIISAPDTESGTLYQTFSKLVEEMERERDFTIDEKLRAVSVTDEGINRVEKLLEIGNLYTEGGIKYVHHLEQALRAKALYHREKDYVVQNDEVIIVDEFTGRLMAGRRWSEGLHQAIEAKEGVSIQRESRTVASITFQNYFRLYEKLAGMTGTAATSIEEFQKVYDLDVVVIPTNKPLIRRDLPDKVLQNESGKWKAVIQEIKARTRQGQPILVGTSSIEKNEFLGTLLKREGIRHQVLNAKNHEEEAKVIAQAGKPGAVTVATNMAGRGVDIILGGNPPDAKEADKILKVGGLFVLGTERHEARRIDNQLRGRAGRQGDPGETQFYVSFDDDLLRIFGSEKIKNMMKTFNIPEDQPVENKMVSRALESAQAKVEGFSFDTRKHLLEYDNVMNKHRSAVYRRRKEVLFASPEEILSKTSELYFVNDHPELSSGKKGEKEEFDKKMESLSKEAFAPALQALWLQTIDHFWMEHLEVMEHMRSSVRLRAYGQRDPLIEYKNEAIRLFRELEASIEDHVANLALRIGSEPARVSQQPLLEIHQEAHLVGEHPSKHDPSQHGHAGKIGLSTAAPRTEAKVGRNDPCPCGSGKKYKKCHGQ